MKELMAKNITELHRLLAESRNELRELKFRASERQLGAVHRIRTLKIDIARILTAINAKTNSASNQAA